MDNTGISLAVIKRLPRYYRYLRALLDNNVVRVSSRELSDKMNITASQIRQDFNNFGSFGQQGYGYDVKHLYLEIQKILGLSKEYKLVIIGAGNIGRALANYSEFWMQGFCFAGIFDNNPELVGRFINNIQIHHMDKLEEFVKYNPVHIAVLAVPEDSAEKVAEVVTSYGIKGIWNFSYANINTSLMPDIKIENVHLTDSLMTLIYKLNEDAVVKH